LKTGKSRWPALIARACLLTAAATLLAPPIAALATRGGLIGYRLGIPVAGLGLIIACLGLVVALVLLCLPAMRAQRRLLVVALLLFAAPALLAARIFSEASGLPVIHDISTDLTDPPVYLVTPTLRNDGENSLDIDPVVLAAQADAYPEIAPLYLDATVPQVFALVVALMEASDWKITRSAPLDREIEAVATTFWFGFRDDVIVRLRSDGTRTQVDMRSSSRVGRSDIGANARRIEEFLALLENSQAHQPRR
jgi:uncharacterized protein (DUF1499 family)